MKLKAVILAVMLCLCGVCFANKGGTPGAPGANIETVAVNRGSEAAAAPAAPAEQKGDWMSMMLPLILIVVMIFIFSRSNKKQQQKRQQMLDRITKGSKVMLNSGVYAKVVEVRENDFLVEIAENVNVLVIKNGVASVEDEEAKKDAK